MDALQQEFAERVVKWFETLPPQERVEFIRQIADTFCLDCGHVAPAYGLCQCEREIGYWEGDDGV